MPGTWESELAFSWEHSDISLLPHPSLGNWGDAEKLLTSWAFDRWDSLGANSPMVAVAPAGVPGCSSLHYVVGGAGTQRARILSPLIRSCLLQPGKGCVYWKLHAPWASAPSLAPSTFWGHRLYVSIKTSYGRCTTDIGKGSRFNWEQRTMTKKRRKAL